MKKNKSYNPRPEYGDRIIDEASDWFVRLQDSELTSRDREAFADWLSASPEHVREYLALTLLHGAIGELPSARSVEDLIELARQTAAENVIPLTPQDCATDTRTHRQQSRGFRWMAAAAVTAAMALLIWQWPLLQSVVFNTYTTSTGEQKSFPLPDGSLVTLNAVSKLRIHYTSRYRDVQLLSGEALFTVAKNRARPFRVLTSDSVIQAVGTQFDVYYRHARTAVTVVEGTVEIRPADSQRPAEPAPSQAIRLTQGQRAQVRAPNLPVSVSAADPAVATAWRERRLTFESRPLAEVIAEFNLYNSTPLEIRDAELETVQVSGSFNANDPQSFVLFLDEAGIARSTTQPDRILLRAAAKTAH